jgi:dsDNA-specific endonuclease/ATPase MutS2
MTTRAQKIVDATMELTLRPQQGDRARVIAAAIREVVNQLENTYEIKTGIHRTGMIFCADLLELCEELEKL